MAGATSSPFCQITSDEYLRDRVNDQIAWYDRKSGANKKGFLWLQVLTLLASAAIPVLSIGSERLLVRVLVAVLGSLIVVIAGIVSLWQCREHWIEYRTTAESLKNEKYLFLTRTGPYTGEDAFAVFVEHIESILNRQNTAWQQRLRSQEKPDQGEADAS